MRKDQEFFQKYAKMTKISLVLGNKKISRNVNFQTLGFVIALQGN